jgi:hypothetical protein
MLYLVVLMVTSWAIVSGIACLSVCAAAARFNREVEQL